MFCRILLVIATISFALLFQKYRNLTKPLEPPAIDVQRYWGRGSVNAYREDTTIKLKDISYGSVQIDELKRKLNEKINLHEPLEGVAFQYGMNTNKLKEIINYWRDTYLAKWNEREQFLKSFAHYTTQIQGLNIHFIHQKPTSKSSKGKKIVPLLLLHGWPGSVREFYDIIPKLAGTHKDLNDIEFEIIVPSLPGYGWSDAAAKTGFGITEMSIVIRNLMIRLGYERFYIQGGDWGSALGSTIATLFPQNVIGYHSNMCFSQSTNAFIKSMIASLYPSYFIPEEYVDFVFPLGEKFMNLLSETGYMHIQATKPDTIGTTLTNNPIGLAAYILEKFSTWTDPKYKLLNHGGLDNDFSKDALLDNIMIYYMTNSITTSMRLYSEALSTAEQKYQIDRVPTSVPTGCARFKHDLGHSLDWQLTDKFTNVVHSTYHKNGGHFAAMQLPDILYKDFMEFVKKVEK